MYHMIIIDDEPLVLNYLSDFINNEIPEITVDATFEISANALDYIKTNDVDIILTDISMPEPTGIDIARICHEKIPDTIVIFISGYREFEYAHSAMTYNVQDYILKPISKQTLCSSLSNAINLLDSRSGHSEFKKNDLATSCQEVFSDLICNCISGDAELKERLRSIGLSGDVSDNKCIIFDIYIKDIEKYLREVWRYSKDDLFDALLHFFCKETENTFFAPIWHTAHRFEIIAIGKKSNLDFDGILSDFMANIQYELKELMSIDSVISSQKVFAAVNSMVSDKNISDFDNDLITKARKYIEKNYANPITLEDVAKYVSLSRVYFSSYYKKHTGENFITTLNNIRIKKAMELLKDPNIGIVSVMHATGYNHSTHFHKIFKKIVGCSPAEYQEKIIKEGEKST